MLERLQKIIARAGVASRREAETLITDGKVTVNGELITELGHKADPNEDHIKVKGKLIQVEEERKYILLYKPKGFVSTVHDPEGRPTVTDLLQEANTRLYPVGRLDFNTEGVLLLTNDGTLTHQLLAPKSKCPKTYTVKVSGQPDPKTIMRLQRGITVDGNRYGSCQIEMLKGGQNSWLRVVLFEGKNHQIKKMFEAVGHPVSKLRRIAFAFLTTKGLRPGEWRNLNKVEVDRLQRGDYDFLTPLNPFKFLREVGVGLRLSDYEAYRKAHGGPPPTRSKAPGRPRFGSRRPGQQRSGPRKYQRDGERFDSRDDRRSGRKDGSGYGSRDDRRPSRDEGYESRDRRDSSQGSRDGRRPERREGGYGSRDNRRDRPGGHKPRERRDGGYESRDGRRPERREGGYKPRDRRDGGYESRDGRRPERREGGYKPRERRDGGYESRDGRRPERREGGYKSRERRDGGSESRDGRRERRDGGFGSRDGRRERRDGGFGSRDGRRPNRRDDDNRRSYGESRDRDRRDDRRGDRPRGGDRGSSNRRYDDRRDEGSGSRGQRDRGPRREGEYRRDRSEGRGDRDRDSRREGYRGRSDDNRGGSNRGKPARFKAKRPQKAWSKSFDRSDKKDPSKK